MNRIKETITELVEAKKSGGDVLGLIDLLDELTRTWRSH